MKVLVVTINYYTQNVVLSWDLKFPLEAKVYRSVCFNIYIWQVIHALVFVCDNLSRLLVYADYPLYLIFHQFLFFKYLMSLIIPSIRWMKFNWDIWEKKRRILLNFLNRKLGEKKEVKGFDWRRKSLGTKNYNCNKEHCRCGYCMIHVYVELIANQIWIVDSLILCVVNFTFEVGIKTMYLIYFSN